MADNMVPPAERTRARGRVGTSSGAGDTVFAPDHNQARLDRSLEPYAEFELGIGSNFPGSYSSLGALYDDSTHRYLRKYLHPSSWRLMFSARPGLDRARAERAPHGVAFAAATSSRTLSDVVATDGLERFLDETGLSPVTAMRTAVGGLGAIPEVDLGGVIGPSAPPAELTAYDWLVSKVGGGFGDHLIVQNPDAGTPLGSFTLPEEGTYDLRLRVYFDGNRYAERSVRFQFQELYIASIGDSYASGQGNPDRTGALGWQAEEVCQATTISYKFDARPWSDRDPIWLEKKAHRSLASGPARAATALQNTYGRTWSANGIRGKDFRFTKVVFASFARSGARIDLGLLEPQEGNDDFVGVGQLDELQQASEGRRIDALFISIGGNDAGFAGVLTDLVAKDSTWLLFNPDSVANRDAVRRRVDDLIKPAGEIERRFNELHRAVGELRKHLDIGEVYITGYPTELFFVEGTNGRSEFRACEVFASTNFLINISERDGIEIRRQGEAVNALVTRKATEFGWHFVDVAPDFVGHGYCQRGPDRMLVQAEESCLQQMDWDGTMHPNAVGSEVYGRRLLQAFRAHSTTAAGRTHSTTASDRPTKRS